MDIPLNPYVTRSMITEPDEFYGRTSEIGRIYARLSRPHPQSISIVGDRRMGKSSLLYQIYLGTNRKAYLDSPDDDIFLYLDFQQAHEWDVPAFFRNLFERLHNRWPKTLTKEDTPDYQGFRQLAARLTHQEKKLILLCDEFEAITRNEDFDFRFFSNLRSIANEYHVAYVVSSRRDLQQLCHSKEIEESPFFNIFELMPLGAFRPNEAKAFIAKPSEAAGYPLQGYTEFIVDLAGYFPFYLQLACSAFFDILLDHPPTHPPDLTQIKRRFHSQAKQHFRYWWEHLSLDYQNVIRAVLARKQISAKQSDTVDQLQEVGYIIEEENADGYCLASSGMVEYLNQQPQPSDENLQPITIFLSYAREDETLRQQLENHLAPMVREGKIEIWHDRKIPKGREWEKAVHTHLKGADIIVLLVSAYFIGSDYCTEVEAKMAMERYERQDAYVIPVILREVDWEGSMPYSKLQALPTDAKPVNSNSWKDADEAFKNVAQGIREVVEEAIVTAKSEKSLSGGR